MRIKLYFVFTILMTGCSNLTVYHPSSMMEVPEVLPFDSQAGVEAGLESGYAYTSTRFASDRPLVWDSEYRRTSLPYAKIRFPIRQEIPLELGGQFNLTGFGAHMKYQFMGPRFSKGQSGDSSLALVLSADSSWMSRKSEETSTALNDGPWEGSINSVQLGGEVIYGYRTNDRFLIYAGPAAYVMKVTSNVKQLPTATSSGGEFDHTDQLTKIGPVVGALITFNSQFAFHVEGAYYSSKSKEGVDVPPETVTSAGFKFEIFKSRPTSAHDPSLPAPTSAPSAEASKDSQ